MNRSNFFAELKRRNVYKVAVTYAVVSWLLLQLASILFPTFEAPSWAMKVFVAMIAAGFLIAVVLGWAFELTPEGLKRTGPPDPASQPGKKSHTWISIVVVGVALSIALFLLGRYTANTHVGITGPRGTATVTPDKSIAVLPFENLSEEKSNAYFADGIQAEILTKLAVVRDLKVISRTSTEKYQSKPDNLRSIAQELGVTSILEGSVQKAGDKVRVNVQLIDTRTDTHIWAKSYDRDLKDVLAVESEVAGEIAEAMKANLSPVETNVLAATSTSNLEAHDLFLRGEYERRQAESNPRAETFDRATAFYRQALTHDPNLVEAAASLARTRLYRHWFVSPLAPEELAEVKSVIDRALEHSPRSPEAHYALGLYYYWGHREYDRALEEFKETLDLQPNNTSAQQFCGWVYRRRGEWQRSITAVQRAQELDPRDAGIPASLGGTYLYLRLWDDAERSELRALELDPHKAEAALLRALTYLNSKGDINSARQVFAGFAEEVRLSGRILQGDVLAIFGIRTYLEVLERHFKSAAEAFEKETDTSDSGRLQQLAGRTVLPLLEGNIDQAKTSAEQAQPSLEARVRDRPDDTFAMIELSWVYLALGRNSDALRLSRQAAGIMSIEKDALSGTFFQSGLAQIEARGGEPEAAVSRLRHLLSIPAGQPISIARLRIDPVWDPIRNNPGFQQLLTIEEHVGP